MLPNHYPRLEGRDAPPDTAEGKTLREAGSRLTGPPPPRDPFDEPVGLCIAWLFVFLGFSWMAFCFLRFVWPWFDHYVAGLIGGGS